MARTDPHSFADDTQPSTERMILDLSMDFLQRTVHGAVTLHLDRPAGGPLDLDTRDLTIESVCDEDGAAVPFALGPEDRVLGRRLRVTLDGSVVRIAYRTAPHASALQWLSPAMTAGGEHPFVFTQCQPIHARSIVPCQDTPRCRVRFEARLTVPKPLTAVMAAASGPREDVDDERAAFHFSMPQPIPPYLLAFAAGDLTAKDLGARSRVVAEPSVIDAAAWELAEVDRHLETAETLFGPYPWERFDILVMPPSFPYGGMENPRLTFITPSLLAGDRSLVSVVAHELAHSWTGNLVTNANANHFWLNEGFTVYAERRIVEAVYGEAARSMQAAVARAHLERDIARLARTDPRLTHLRLDLTGVDPDSVFSTVPYEKGYLFLLRLEQNAGRARFDAFLQRYIERFRFTSIETDDLVALLRAEFPEVIAGVDLTAWLDGPGLPPDAPTSDDRRLAELTALARAWAESQRPDPAALEALTPDEWQAFLSALPATLPVDDVAWAEARFSLSTAGNTEIRVAWLTVATRSGYAPALDATRKTLLAYGRMKYLRPLYTALMQAGGDGPARAAEIFAEAKDHYHPVAQSLVAGLLA